MSKLLKLVKALFRSKHDTLPAPDPSVYRSAHLADQQARYISRLNRQG
jgi:hypothetical protein